MKKTFFAQVKRTAKYYRKGFLLSWKTSRTYYPIVFLQTTLETVKPYVALVFSALFLDELLVSRDGSRLFYLAAALVISECVLSMALNYLHIRSDEEHYFFNKGEEYLFLEKVLQMDYADIEDAAVRNLYTEVREASHAGDNHNLLALRHEVMELWQNLLNLSISIGMLTGFVRQAAFPIWAWAAFLSVYLVCSRLDIKSRAKSEKIWQEYSKEITPFCRARDALSDYLKYYPSGKNIRIYQSDSLALNRLAHWHSRNDEAIDRMHSATLHMMIPFSHIPGSILAAAVEIFVALAALAGSISIGNITKYVSCVSIVSKSLSGLGALLTSMRYNADYLERYFSFLERPNIMHQGCLPVEKRHDNEYVIEFDHVSFRYPGTDVDVLKDINLTFQVGEKMAIVGMNGSGKTTFIKLLCRLYDPTEGVIRLNGIDIRKFDYQEYLSLFSIVFQDYQLFSFPVGENVAASSEVDEKRAGNAMEKAGLNDFLKRLSKGLDTVLYTFFDEDGIQPSGGEEQKIALARAIYKNAPYVLLDEPTAALDPVAEFEIYSRFQEIVGDRTTVFISHRLSSCRFCKDIAVFHEGRLVQRGSHDELVAQKDGKYYELWNAQAQYYVTS